ncbi:Spo0B domain-containing protein [Psychrobacillus psychrodurans]|jgi:stage 0 sporulation protein B (sporulation initiation phosphotransferase)|uniref:Spo0B domain-containing protein n=1 Tax=Psychrobacillus TaxID=1221880 RepID=UPI0008F40EBF|nr:Spo0B domain-containing protein [Psychrobacillus psychrodurans]MCK1996547.1 Spo0B domain-containing protein [Psychrobacillus psychrodurans]MCZ8542120.1 Spo0B domain-containing protein [Psychrobacillus psychrodurans]SFN17746.1 stage 0 sporulation protein B (sporulation initiation phosphotransferase) [Psychrobacillus psychrodurans]
MDHNEITLNEVLRHTMHDFLNNMHILQMNIDMGKPEEARALIQKYSQKCNQFFDINNIGLYKTNEWLQTFGIKYNQLTLDVQTSLLNRKAEKYDDALKDYLNRFVQAIYPHFRGYQEQLLKVHIISDEFLEILIDIRGDWSNNKWQDELTGELFQLQVLETTDNSIKVKLIASGRLE